MTVPEDKLRGPPAKRASDIDYIARVIVSCCLLVLAITLILSPGVPDRYGLVGLIVAAVAGYWLRH